jgi:hypothetical protein
MKSAGLSTSTGKGLNLTSEFFDLLNRVYENSIKLSVIDLDNDKDDASGTRIEISIPVRF